MTDSVLLDAGTNELELIVFYVGENAYGINVAKMKEIIQQPTTTQIPNTPAAIAGTFQLRDKVLSLVDLREYLQEESDAPDSNSSIVLVVEMNQILCGVLVDSVTRIYRLSWDQIESPGEFLINLGVPITGVTSIDNKIVSILDFETILGELFGHKPPDNIPDRSLETAHDREKLKVLVADDSASMRTGVHQILSSAGFENISLCADGEQAWKSIENAHDAGEPFDIILSDIEMPQMDGLHLTSNIKSDMRFRDVPVVLFSSLINETNYNKGISVGANAQVTKFKGNELIDAIDKCLGEMADTSD